MAGRGRASQLWLAMLALGGKAVSLRQSYGRLGVGLCNWRKRKRVSKGEPSCAVCLRREGCPSMENWSAFKAPSWKVKVHSHLHPSLQLSEVSTSLEDLFHEHLLGGLYISLLLMFDSLAGIGRLILETRSSHLPSPHQMCPKNLARYKNNAAMHESLFSYNFYIFFSHSSALGFGDRSLLGLQMSLRILLGPHIPHKWN